MKATKTEKNIEKLYRIMIILLYNHFIVLV
jgi:hypothetical protein